MSSPARKARSQPPVHSGSEDTDMNEGTRPRTSHRPGTGHPECGGDPAGGERRGLSARSSSGVRSCSHLGALPGWPLRRDLAVGAGQQPYSGPDADGAARADASSSPRPSSRSSLSAGPRAASGACPHCTGASCDVVLGGLAGCCSSRPRWTMQAPAAVYSVCTARPRPLLLAGSDRAASSALGWTGPCSASASG